MSLVDLEIKLADILLGPKEPAAKAKAALDIFFSNWENRDVLLAPEQKTHRKHFLMLLSALSATEPVKTAGYAYAVGRQQEAGSEFQKEIYRTGLKAFLEKQGDHSLLNVVLTRAADKADGLDGVEIHPSLYSYHRSESFGSAMDMLFASAETYPEKIFDEMAKGYNLMIREWKKEGHLDKHTLGADHYLFMIQHLRAQKITDENAEKMCAAALDIAGISSASEQVQNALIDALGYADKISYVTTYEEMIYRASDAIQTLLIDDDKTRAVTVGHQLAKTLPQWVAKYYMARAASDPFDMGRRIQALCKLSMSSETRDEIHKNILTCAEMGVTAEKRADWALATGEDLVRFVASVARTPEVEALVKRAYANITGTSTTKLALDRGNALRQMIKAQKQASLDALKS